MANKFFSHFIAECQCKYAVRFEMKSRVDTKLTGCNEPIRRRITKHYDWFALLNKF